MKSLSVGRLVINDMKSAKAGDPELVGSQIGRYIKLAKSG